MRGLLLHEFGFVLCLRAQYAEALALAERTQALSRATEDPVLMLGVCTVQAQVQMLRGRPRLAREWAERFLATSDSLDQAVCHGTLVADPRVTMLGMLAIHLVHLGLVEQGRARMREARTRARSLAQPMAQGVALWQDAMLEVRFGNAVRVAELAREMQTIVDEFEFAQGRVACRWFGGWAQARMGNPRDGYRLLRDAYEENVRLGMRAGASELLGYCAEALVRAGDCAAAQQQLDEALEIVTTLGERVYLPQLLLIQAAIADARGEPAAACASIRRAVAEAREQEAPWLELMTRLELCQRHDSTAEERHALAELVDGLPEAIDTPALTRARALLDDMTGDVPPTAQEAAEH
jgi:ATP/maltotriose-dependent transcriptional regulator MalT